LRDLYAPIHYLRGKLQRIAANGVGNFHGIIRAFHLARVPRVLEVLKDFVVVHFGEPGW
jgi:hypothetical protein